MVLVVLDGVGGKETAVELIPVLGLSTPFSYRLKHVTLKGVMLIANGRVMEGTEHIVDHLVNRDTWVLPSVHDSAAV